MFLSLCTYKGALSSRLILSIIMIYVTSRKYKHGFCLNALDCTYVLRILSKLNYIVTSMTVTQQNGTIYFFSYFSAFRIFLTTFRIVLTIVVMVMKFVSSNFLCDHNIAEAISRKNVFLSIFF